MKVLTAEQMRQADRLTINSGVAGIGLMENAAHRVVEELVREFSPLAAQNIIILCGKGNNGGDGLAIARVLHDAGARRIMVVLGAEPEEYTGDALTNLKRLGEAGIIPQYEVPPKLRDRKEFTLVIDAILGTGITGAPKGKAAELIAATRMFPNAKIVSVDLPSGLGAPPEEDGDIVKADITVTFTAPKVEHYLADRAQEHVGRLVVGHIGTPPWFLPGGLEVSEPARFKPLFAPRARSGHKGTYGHVLVIGGAEGKTGAATMAALSALRSGAGLVSVTSREATLFAPELMTESFDDFSLERKTVIAVGPGLGHKPELLQRLMAEADVPLVIDADGLNSIAGTDFKGKGLHTILTPHPGEMARLIADADGNPGDVSDRLTVARQFAKERNVVLVLKGNRTLIAFPDGNVWINDSGSPAMGTGGTGDILTGMIAGLIAQHPHEIPTAVRAAVWLHGRAGEIGAAELTEQCLIATDLLKYLPQAIKQVTTPPQVEERELPEGASHIRPWADD